MFDLISLAVFGVYASVQLYLNHRKPKKAPEKPVEAPKPKTRYEAGPGTTSNQSAREQAERIEALRMQKQSAMNALANATRRREMRYEDAMRNGLSLSPHQIEMWRADLRDAYRDRVGETLGGKRIVTPIGEFTGEEFRAFTGLHLVTPMSHSVIKAS